MLSQRRTMQWLTAWAVVAALACVVGFNARAVYAACNTGCHLGDKIKNGATSWRFSNTNARDTYFTTGSTGGTKQEQTPNITATVHNYYTAECPDKTQSWCSALSTPTTSTITATHAFCAGS